MTRSELNARERTRKWRATALSFAPLRVTSWINFRIGDRQNKKRGLWSISPRFRDTRNARCPHSQVSPRSLNPDTAKRKYDPDFFLPRFDFALSCSVTLSEERINGYC